MLKLEALHYPKTYLSYYSEKLKPNRSKVLKYTRHNTKTVIDKKINNIIIVTNAKF